MLLALGDFVCLHLQLATQLLTAEPRMPGMLTSEMIQVWCLYYLQIFWFIRSVIHFREMVFVSSYLT